MVLVIVTKEEDQGQLTDIDPLPDPDLGTAIVLDVIIEIEIIQETIEEVAMRDHAQETDIDLAHVGATDRLQEEGLIQDQDLWIAILVTVVPDLVIIEDIREKAVLTQEVIQDQVAEVH